MRNMSVSCDCEGKDAQPVVTPDIGLLASLDILSCDNACVDLIYNLPKGATPVDFAYALHTDIGHHCIGARVNHHVFPLSRSLQSGQSVEIITSSQACPNAIWLSTVVTSRARSSIRQYLKGLRSQECQLIGRRLLQNALRPTRIESLSQQGRRFFRSFTPRLSGPGTYFGRGWKDFQASGGAQG